MADSANTTNAPTATSLLRGFLVILRLRATILYLKYVKLPLTARRYRRAGGRP